MAQRLLEPITPENHIYFAKHHYHDLDAAAADDDDDDDDDYENDNSNNAVLMHGIFWPLTALTEKRTNFHILY